jgi:uncharacterized protein (DUF1501 family)
MASGRRHLRAPLPAVQHACHAYSGCCTVNISQGTIHPCALPSVHIVACGPVAGQRLGKHVPTATNRRTTIEVLLETGVSTRSVPRSYKEDNWGDHVSSVWKSVKRGLEHVKLKNLHC